MMKDRLKVALILLAVAIPNLTGALVTQTLIDFTKFEEEVRKWIPEPKVTELVMTNGQPKALLSAEEFMLDRWVVELNNSARNMRLQNIVLSYCKKVRSSKYGDVLGVRVHFPREHVYSYAVIKPPYEFYAYDENGRFFMTNSGILPNVHSIKKIAIWINGRNYNYGLAIRLKDRDDKVHEFFMGWLRFDGWRKLVWENPNFVDKVLTYTLKRQPLYPRSIPYYKFDSIVIYKPAFEQGGDFVTYIKDITVTFKPFVVEPIDEIDDESIWNILSLEAIRKKLIEEKRITEEVILKKQEEARLKVGSKKLGLTPTGGPAAGGNP